MINITAFSKKHPNGERNRGCIKSPELLDRIDKVLTSDEISAKKLEDLEQVIRRTNTCVVTPWLMTDLYNLDGMIVKFDITFEKPVVEAPKAEAPKVKAPKGTDPDGGVQGEPGPTGDKEPESITEQAPENQEPINTPAPAETQEPANEPASEPVNEAPAETQEPANEPAPENNEQPADEAAVPKKGGRKKKESAE